MFKTRLISGIVLVIIMIALVGLGGDVLLLGILAASLIGIMELCRVFQMEKSPLAIVTCLADIAYFANLRFHFLMDDLILFNVFMIILMFIYVFAFPKYRAKQVMAAFFGLFYVGVMLSYVYRIRTVQDGLYLTIPIFLCTWGCDTCAYCAGVLFGKHKMAPKLSPKKSIEGAVGGVVGAALLTVLYAFILNAVYQDISVKEMIVLGCIAAVGALISMVGDLTASAIKRNYDIKDYGTLIPGHGGILDRFDSMIITAPIIYYLAMMFI